MNGLAALVPTAELLAKLTGDRRAAAALAARLIGGAGALPRGVGDLHTAIREHLVAVGVLDTSGAVAPARAAELLVVCEVLAAASDPPPANPPEPRLVLSAPHGMADVADIERLDGLVLDVIRQSTQSLHIGGAFWNDDGFALLNQTLKPALTSRALPTTIYCNVPAESGHRAALERQLTDLQTTGPVTVLWFVGPAPTMLHAKFVIGDQRRGYLGTANLTSWGMRGRHIEAGVELFAGQCRRLVRFLTQLTNAGMFCDAPPREDPPKP